MTAGSGEVCLPAVPLLVSAGPPAHPGPPRPLPGLQPLRLVPTQAGHQRGQDYAGENTGWVLLTNVYYIHFWLRQELKELQSNS